MQIGAIQSESSFIAGKVNGCLERYRISIGIGYIVLFLSSWLLSYIYFTTAQQIFEFSRSRRLRTNNDINVSKRFLLLIISFFLAFCAAFLVSTLMLSNKKEWEKSKKMDFVIGLFISLFSLLTFFGFVTSAVLIKISNVEPVHESQMSVCKMITIGLLYLAMSVLQMAGAFS